MGNKNLLSRLSGEKKQNDDFLFWKPQEIGKSYRVRILPPLDYPKDDLDYDGWYKRIIQHYLDNSITGLQQSYFICSSSENDKRTCPVCKYISKLWRSKDTNGKNEIELYRKLKGSEKFAVNILVYDLLGKKDDEGNLINPVKIFQIPVSLMKKILEAIFKQGWNNVWDLEKGYDLIVIKNKKTVPTNSGGTITIPDYSSSMFAKESTPAFKNEKLKKYAYEHWFHDLNEIIKINDDSEMAEALQLYLENWGKDEVIVNKNSTVEKNTNNFEEETKFSKALNTVEKIKKVVKKEPDPSPEVSEEIDEIMDIIEK